MVIAEHRRTTASRSLALAGFALSLAGIGCGSERESSNVPDDTSEGARTGGSNSANGAMSSNGSNTSGSMMGNGSGTSGSVTNMPSTATSMNSLPADPGPPPEFSTHWFEKPYVAVAAADTHTCAIRADDGQVECWGDDAFGKSTPPAGVAFESITAGNYFTCGLRSPGRELECWGRVNGDILRDDDIPPPLGVAFASIDGGSSHACGIRADNGATECWGNNDRGAATPPAGASFREIAVGVHSCGLRSADGTAECWGSENRSGELDTPVGVALEGVSVDNYGGCGIRTSDKGLQCWGNVDDFTEYLQGIPFTQISQGGFEVCGVRADDGSLQCLIFWAPLDFQASFVAAGPSHRCAIRATDGFLFCWGIDSYGSVDP